VGAGLGQLIGSDASRTDQVAITGALDMTAGHEKGRDMTASREKRRHPPRLLCTDRPPLVPPGWSTSHGVCQAHDVLAAAI
jgi:hypothetical protein